jgi:hypothetical protein
LPFNKFDSHDPLVASIYPAARPGTEGWAVRPDADPKPR